MLSFLGFVAAFACVLSIPVAVTFGARWFIRRNR